MIYLASPYTHEDKKVRDQRYHEACRAVMYLYNTYDITPFSPIVYSHWLYLKFRKDLDESAQSFDYWAKMDRDFMRRCGRIIVLTLDGWELSRGINEEIQYMAINELVTRHYIDFLHPFDSGYEISQYPTPKWNQCYHRLSIPTRGALENGKRQD